MYAGLPNYRNNWLRLGFTDDEIEQRDPRFIDALVAWGDADAVRSRVQAHHDVGVDHVCIQPLSVEGFGQLDWSAARSARAERLSARFNPTLRPKGLERRFVGRFVNGEIDLCRACS